MISKMHWFTLLAVLKAMMLVGGWGFTHWVQKLAIDPLLASGWMVTCAMAAIFGSVGFSVLLTLSPKVR